MKSLTRSAASLLLMALCLPSLAGASSAPATHEFRLDNGLKLIVREDHRAPVVVSQLWYKVGSSYETPGKTGLSHALEHMMFKGSAKLGPGESSRVLRELGAEENAFTSDDYTAYYQVLASDRLSVAFELEADRLASLRLPPEEFKREIEVIKEERRLRTEDNPSAKAYERFQALAFPASGYHTPTIGWMADLERMTVEELRAWYETWYVPNNATLVVVGDVVPSEVHALAQRYFGSIAQRPVPQAQIPLELSTPGQRLLTLHLPTQLPSLMMGFNVPGLATSKTPREVHALRLIGALLDGGYSARLPSRLERGEELVSGAGSSYDAMVDDALIGIDMVSISELRMDLCRPMRDIEAAVQCLLDAGHVRQAPAQRPGVYMLCRANAPAPAPVEKPAPKKPGPKPKLKPAPKPKRLPEIQWAGQHVMKLVSYAWAPQPRIER